MKHSRPFHTENSSENREAFFIVQKGGQQHYNVILKDDFSAKEEIPYNWVDMFFKCNGYFYLLITNALSFK